MKIFEKLKSFASDRKNELYSDDVVAEIMSELDKRKEERRPFELQWRLNSAFLAGKQNCDVNPYSGELEELIPVYEYEERGVFNKIAPLMETRLANLKSVKFDVAVKPLSDECEDYDKADVETKLLRSLYKKDSFDDKKNTLLEWSEITGTAFVLSGWNSRAGKATSVDDKGNPSSYEGELYSVLLTPYEVYPENLYRQSMEEQNSVIIEQVLSAKEIYNLFGIECKGRDIDSITLTPAPNGDAVSYTDGGYVRSRDSERVITYFERPSRTNPEGVMCVIAAGKVVYLSGMPYEDIPLTVFRAKENACQFFGKSVIEDLIPLQRAYNGCKNKMHDYISTLAANSLLVEEGSVDLDEMEENGTAPGTPVVYKKGYNAPIPLSHESIPTELYAECEQLVRDMEYVAGVSQLMVVGSTNVGVSSGVAINSLREIDSTRMALTAENMRSGILNMSKMWLAICRKFCKPGYVLSATGNNDAAQVLTWCSEDINSFDVYFETENELKYSEENQKQAFLQAYNMGLFADENGKVPDRFKMRAVNLMHIGDYDSLMSEGELQSKRAKRENTLLLSGVIPETDVVDDDAVHLDEHRRFALQMRYDSLKRRRPDLAEGFERHCAEHAERMSKNG